MAISVRSLYVAIALAAAAAAQGRDGPREALLTTPHFAFYSDFATNLNDALIVAGMARNAGEPELFDAGPGTDCFDALAPSLRAGWNLAVDYYAEVISPVDWGDRQQYLVRIDLAGIDGEAHERARRFTAMAADFRSVAGHAYDECYWSRQDAENRAVIDRLATRLDAHEATIARRLERLYATPWHGLPIAVDVVARAPPKGANSIILSPAGGHVLMSSSLDGYALETVFHEASHTITAPWRGDPLPRALEQAAKRLGVALPRDLWHVVMFYLTGETVRAVLREAGEPDYMPYVYGRNLFRGAWKGYREPIETVMPAYLAGRSELADAASRLVQRIVDASGASELE